MVVIVFDLDGVLWDDITKIFKEKLDYSKFGYLLRGSEESILRYLLRGFEEGIMFFPNLVPALFSSKVDPSKMDLDSDILNLMKDLQNQENNNKLHIRTVNNGPVAKMLRKKFDEEGIKASIEQIKTLDKWHPINGEQVILVEDNPLVALIAAKHNCPTVLYLKHYNTFLSMFFSLLNDKIKVVSNVYEMLNAIQEFKNMIDREALKQTSQLNKSNFMESQRLKIKG